MSGSQLSNPMMSDSPSQPQFNLEGFSQKVGLVSKKQPSELVLLDDNLPFHAARLLLLIKFAGAPQSNPRIEGRTKLAKLDFFVRYPLFLEKAAMIFQAKEQLEKLKSVMEKNSTVESHMIRYKYGPWDKKYYLVFAYLSGKKLVEISSAEKVDHFYLSSTGKEMAKTLSETKEFGSMVTRCQIAGELFFGRSGNSIKEFVYRHFPEVVRTPYTQIIPLATSILNSDET